jgi:DNA-binding CsgD family transcriptional regulator
MVITRTEDEGRLRAFATKLESASGFVEIAKLVCATTATFGIARCVVMLASATGLPVITVDNAADPSSSVCDDRPLWSAIREHLRPIDGIPAGARRVLMLPLYEPAGVLGAIRCESRRGFSAVTRLDLIVLSALVSVRLAQLGATCPGERDIVLTPRQCEVARLAASGYTNHEVADALSISTNTVKNRLKEVFTRLHICNRVELVVALQQRVPFDDVPVGVVHDGEFTITRRPE